MKTVKIKRLSENGFVPTQANKTDAGYDLYSVEDVEIKSMDRVLIHTDIAIELPKGFEAQIRPRSGLAAKNGITVLNSPGTIDESYRGQICVIAINLSKKKQQIKFGDRIAQVVFKKVEYVNFKEVDQLSNTERGGGGFGSSGK